MVKEHDDIALSDIDSFQFEKLEQDEYDHYNHYFSKKLEYEQGEIYGADFLERQENQPFYLKEEDVIKQM